MNEQKNPKSTRNAQPGSNLIYTHKSPPSSNHHSCAGHQTSNGRDGQRATSQSEGRADGICAEHEHSAVDTLEREADLTAPHVPPLTSFPGSRTDYRHVLKRLDYAHFCMSKEGASARSEALKYFRHRYGQSDWMQQQPRWMENASLVASVGPFSLNPLRILYCSARGKLCCLPDYCFRCNLDQRVEPLQKMFQGTYKKRPFWHALVLDYEMDADRAGIWTGLRQECRPLLLPHQGKGDGGFFRCSPEQWDTVRAYFGVLFFVLTRLQKAGLIDGWIAVAEPNLSFWPDAASRTFLWSEIDHAFLPHLHVMVCGRHPFDREIIQAIYDVMQDRFSNWSFANLWFNPITSQTDISQWINYCFKPLPLSRWYSNALLAGCDEGDLNLLFDDLVFESCPSVLAGIYSPRRAGVLASNSGSAYILERLPCLLSNKEMTLCRDEQYYSEHEDSFWRTVEKKMIRAGRSFRCRTRSHRAAVRRISTLEHARGSR